MNNAQSNGRRKFIKNTAAGAAAITLGITGLSSFSSAPGKSNKSLNNGYATGFDQQPLPYNYNALEDVIDALTMEIHYSKHAAAYCKNLKEAALAEAVDTNKPLEDVLAKISKYSTKMRNNAGGHYNHEMFWHSMRPKSADNKPTGKLSKMIETSFGSFADFKIKFGEAAKTRFGSGWAWLIVSADQSLKISSTANQDNPLMDLTSVDIHGFPLLGLDVWEHAYYLKYQNRRADYIQNWWNLVNWDFVQQRFENI
jgi:Fe-Mn family superoxide dismutase